MKRRAKGTLFVAGILLVGCNRAMPGIQAVTLAAWDELPVREGPVASGSVALTMYGTDWTLVTDARPLSLDAGEQVVRFPGVAAQTDGTGGYVQVPGDVKARRFRYDLQSQDRLQSRYHGRRVEIYPRGAEEPLMATLWMTDSGPVYRIGDRLYTKPPGRVAFPPMPGLALTPTLEWIVAMGTPFSGIATVSYEANQIGWKPEYTLVTDQNQTRGDWKQWAALSNRSGTSFEHARLTLVAGYVRRDRPPMPMMARAYGGGAAYADVAAPEPYAARYLYRLEQPITLGRDADERVALRAFEGVRLERTYRVETGIRWERQPDLELPKKTRIRLTIPNTAQVGMGEALPGGKVTVYTPTRQGELAIAGEPTIPDTPVAQNLELDLGEAFDVTFERTQTAYRLTPTTQEVGYRVLLRNQQDVPVTVWVTESLTGDWSLTESSHPYERLSATQIRFKVAVPARGTTDVTYQATLQRERTGLSTVARSGRPV